MSKIDWSEYLFRCHQLHKLKTGSIGLKEGKEDRIAELEYERDKGINYNGNKCKWTGPKQEELAKLIAIRDAPWHDQIPQTMKSELRTIHRAETFDRNFVFTNKYVKKGLAQEDEAITTYQVYLASNGIKTFFTKNEERFFNEYFSGVPDLRPVEMRAGELKGYKVGFDTKCSWDLSTFPYKDDALDPRYESQNQGYMDLEDVPFWVTTYVLVNGTEVQVNNEKMKWFYSFQTKDGLPDNPEHPYYESYIKKCKEIERMMIFDYDRFKAMNPGHLLEYSPEEWHNTINPATGLKGLDIPLERRVVEKVSERCPDWRRDMVERIKIGRDYLNYLETL